MTNNEYVVPDELLYSTEHEWLRLEGEIARVGITDYAQQNLGDVVYVLLPKAGDKVSFMEKLGEIESVKVASELFSPLNGEVAEVNSALEDAPELVNNDPYGQGWLVSVRPGDRDALDQLLSPEAYRELIRRSEGLEP